MELKNNSVNAGTVSHEFMAGVMSANAKFYTRELWHKRNRTWRKYFYVGLYVNSRYARGLLEAIERTYGGGISRKGSRIMAHKETIYYKQWRLIRTRYVYELYDKVRPLMIGPRCEAFDRFIKELRAYRRFMELGKYRPEFNI